MRKQKSEKTSNVTITPYQKFFYFYERSKKSEKTSNVAITPYQKLYSRKISTQSNDPKGGGRKEGEAKWLEFIHTLNKNQILRLNNAHTIFKYSVLKYCTYTISCLKYTSTIYTRTKLIN